MRVGVDIVQSSAPKRTAMDGVDRLLSSPRFDGQVMPGARYVLLDDTLTQGATFAELAGHIEAGGARVVAALALSGKRYSARISLQHDSLDKVRAAFGDLEDDFRLVTGYGFESLTESEARYLYAARKPQPIRDRIAAAGSAARRQGSGREDRLIAAHAERRPGGMAVPQLLRLVQRIQRASPGMPPVHVLAGAHEAPDELRATIESRGAQHDVEGAVHEGAIYLFAANLADARRAEHVLIEHELAHLGLRALLGDRLQSSLERIYARNATVRMRADRLMAQVALPKTEAIEEAIVELPSAELPRLTGWRALLSAAADWLARRGFDALPSALMTTALVGMGEQQRADLEVAQLLRSARRCARTASNDAFESIAPPAVDDENSGSVQSRCHEPTP